MARTKVRRRILSLALSVIMLLGMAMPAFATGADDGAVALKRVDNSVISADLGLRRPDNKLEQEEAIFGNVRVSIVLEDKSTIEAGYSTENIADNASAMAYRATLENKQAQMARAISTQALGGAKLDVVWNLTLAANIISANVPYQKIEAIKAVPGVADVVLETRYEPTVVSKGDADPNMATSPEMIGSSMAYDTGYTGAGSRIAIIDTGTDVAHISFDSGAYEYAIIQLANDKRGEDEEEIETFEAAVEALGLELLTEDKIAGVLGELHISKDEGMPQVTAGELYLNSKLPFAFNYIDKDLDVTHDTDGSDAHGSHVAGISAANSYVKQGDEYVPALEAVYVQGVAPEAQLITMKVFGKGGGAYDSDYMAAIEDAIVLECDAVNLSLGSGNPGSRMSAVYQAILDSLAETGLVAVMSAGNSGAWADNIKGLGFPYLYADDVSLDTVGSPGSYANSLAVASVENTGFTGTYLKVGQKMIGYIDTGEDAACGPITALDTSLDKTGTEYDYIFSTGLGSAEEIAAIGAENIAGKIFLCARGTHSFVDKATNASNAGAVGVVIYNNQAGDIRMDLKTYEGTAPAVSITQADGAAIKAASTPSEALGADGKPLYYTGKMTVSGAIAAVAGSARYPYYTMSDFSSWGVPGDLSLKPEITAPGGNIYSVDGYHVVSETDKQLEHDAYVQMSGTSMAAPQVTGMVALVAQYLRDVGLPSGVSPRQMAQSLLMSTARPIDEYQGAYYSVLKQGAGVADVGAAVTAHSYITVDGQPDGKVKVELGDDPARKGVYTFSFTLNNLTDAAATYELSADVFTQYLITEADLGRSDDELPILMDTSTDELPATTVFTVNGSPVTSASVAANGSVTVTATITLTDGIKQLYDAYYNDGLNNGAYVEAYVWAKETATEEGAEGTSHSIPVLGFYGSWSDASMYDRVSFLEYFYGVSELPPYLPGNVQGYNIITNYLTAKSKTWGQYELGGSPFWSSWADIPVDMDYEGYLAQMARSALNNTNGDMLATLTFANIRNAGNAMWQVVDANNTNKVYYRSDDIGAVDAAYYYANKQEWRLINKGLKLNWEGTDNNGNKLPNNTQALVQLVLAPEYYGTIAKDAESGKYINACNWNALLDGNANNGELGEGAILSFPVTIDSQAPYNVTARRGGGSNSNTLTVSARDNQYIAYIAIYNEDGTRLIAAVDPNVDSETGLTVPQTRGAGVTVSFDMSYVYGTKFYVAVYDYAMNQSTYELNEAFTDVDYNGSVMFQDAAGQWSIYANGAVSSLVETDVTFTAAAYADGYIFGTDENGNLYVTDPENVDTMQLIADTGWGLFDDMTYNPDDGYLYGLVYAGNPYYSVVVVLDKLTGDTVYSECITTGLTFDTIAYAGDGVFYLTQYYTGGLCILDTNTLQIGGLQLTGLNATSMEYDEGKLYFAISNWRENFDLNGDGEVDALDAQIILDYLVGNLDIPDDADPGDDAESVAAVERIAQVERLDWAEGMALANAIADVKDSGEADAAEDDGETEPEAPALTKSDLDINFDGEVTTADAQFLLSYIKSSSNRNGQQVLEIDLDEGTIRTVFYVNSKINVLFFPKDGEADWIQNTVDAVELNRSTLELIVDGTAQLTANVIPWTVENKAVTWTSSDPSVATVDADGVVTGVSLGHAIITATAVTKNADGEDVTATCEVTVSALKYTLYGALQDEEGEAKLYTYDLEHMLKPEYGVPLTGAQAIASTTLAGDGDLYVIDDVDGTLHKVNIATGGDTETYNGLGGPLNDIARNTAFTAEDGGDLIHYIDGCWVFANKAPAALDLRGFNLETAVARYTGADEFSAIACGGAVTLPIEDDDGNEVDTDGEWLHIMDNAGYVWGMFLPEDGGLYLWNFFEIKFPGEKPSFQGYNAYPNYCSLVEGDDGSLFLSTFNEGYGMHGTSEIYMLTFDVDENGDGYYAAQLIGNVGDGVWPATLYAVESNEESDESEAAASLAKFAAMDVMGVLELEEKVIETESDKDDAGSNAMVSIKDLDVSIDDLKNADKDDDGEETRISLDEAAKSTTVDLDDVKQSKLEDMNPGKDMIAPMPVNPKPVAPNPAAPMPVTPMPVGGSLMNVSYTADKSSDGTVGVDVSATNSVNGLFEVTCDADVLTLEAITNRLPAGAVYAVNRSEDGKVVLAYASPVNLRGAVFHLDYSYDTTTTANTTVITVKTVEENDKLPGTSQDITVTLREAVVITPPPSKPATNPEPDPEPEPEPDTTLTVTENEDGSTTTTVVDSETGAVTETTEMPDGTVEVVVTEEDGTVTETVTDPDGGVVEKVTDPEENVTITVTNPEGEVLVELALPAEVPESEVRFDDVPEDHWANEAIYDMAALGIVNGVGDDLFDTDADMTRGMMASVLYRLSNGGTGYDTDFDDVDEDAYYADAVAWAAVAGVISGTSENTFAPDEAITREQMVTMLYRYAKLLNLDTTVSDDALNAFEDSDEVSDWAREAMAWCVENGIILGAGDGTLDPSGVAARAQVAVLFARFMALIK